MFHNTKNKTRIRDLVHSSSIMTSLNHMSGFNHMTNSCIISMDYDHDRKLHEIICGFIVWIVENIWVCIMRAER